MSESIEHFPLMIPGAFSSDGVLELRAPYDQTVLATLESADANAVDLALSNAYQLFINRDRWIPLAKRIEILQRVKQNLIDNAEKLAFEAAEEGGKPLFDSKIEVARAIEGIQICIETLRTNAGKMVPMGINPACENRIAYTTHEPIGVVVAVSAFNHPLNLIVHQVIPAIAAGCPVIVKPAEDTPRSCMRLVKMIHDAGLAKEWCQALVTLEINVAEKLVTDSRIGLFSFIGSAKVGWMLRSKLAPGVRCVLEHGGAAPVIVGPDANIDDAVPALAKGGLYHAGQVCVSVQRIFVHESIAEQITGGITSTAKAMRIGNPTHQDTDIGPLIRQREIDRIHSWVEEAISAGARCSTGGERIGASCYAATILFNPPEFSKVSQKEIFGPVICIYPYKNADQAVLRANKLPFAFQASVWTNNLDFALRTSQRLDASTVMVNDHTAFRVDWMPFSGLRESGQGVGGIPYTLHDMQIEKTTVIHCQNI